MKCRPKSELTPRQTRGVYENLGNASPSPSPGLGWAGWAGSGASCPWPGRKCSTEIHKYVIHHAYASRDPGESGEFHTGSLGRVILLEDEPHSRLYPFRPQYITSGQRLYWGVFERSRGRRVKKLYITSYTLAHASNRQNGGFFFLVFFCPCFLSKDCPSSNLHLLI